MRKAGKMTEKFALAYDLGGTKVLAGIVSSKGRILTEIREPVDARSGRVAVLRQLTRMGQQLLFKHPEVRRVGVASAGPLDPVSGVLLDPTNLMTRGKSWGTVPIAAHLRKSLGLPVTLENDAAAAILAEHWLGAARKHRNAVILTLGTGLGTGMICNGELVRAGRGLHPEGGHVIVRMGDRSAPCGCGNFGCAEAYLSGVNFSHRAARVLRRKRIGADEVTSLARLGDARARALFDEYSDVLAHVLHNFIVLYAPEIFVFTGSFAVAAPLFLPRTKKILRAMIARRRKGVDLWPEFACSTLANRAGLLGGAYVALKV